ncbi:MAG: hypothetical protein ABI847_06060 [Anaerolineales bacterium]
MTEETLRPLGRIAGLQIQRSSLKQGQKPNRWFDPAPLLPVKELTLTPAGALARAADGSYLLDIHHGAHPATRNNGSNDISLGFTSHYAAMRDQFGPHLTDGIAGENILIACSAIVRPADLGADIAIRPAAGGKLIWLHGVRVMPPCVEFSTYAGRSAEPEAVKSALQFLGDGLRGFCGRLPAGAAVTIAVGDEVLAGNRPASGSAE